MIEKLSAWMDGELNGEYGRQLPSQLKCNADLRDHWNRYHLIGDSLRGVHGPNLCARLAVRLEAEPTVIAPQSHSPAGPGGRVVLSVAARVASVVFLVFLGWTALPDLKPDSIESSTAPSLPPEPRSAVPLTKGTVEYLLAHQRFSPSNAMYGALPYVRTVAERPIAPPSVLQPSR